MGTYITGIISHAAHVPSEMVCQNLVELQSEVTKLQENDPRMRTTGSNQGVSGASCLHGASVALTGQQCIPLCSSTSAGLRDLGLFDETSDLPHSICISRVFDGFQIHPSQMLCILFRLWTKARQLQHALTFSAKQPVSLPCIPEALQTRSNW